MTGKRAALTNLPDVTLVAVSSIAIRPTVEALHKSMEQAAFGRVLMLSDEPRPDDASAQIEWRRIDRLASRVEYSRFMLQDAADHIATSHALFVQWDGFVLDGATWDPAFLDHDYIGAVWPHFRDGHNVGNGGFSLRSRRLLEACRSLPFESGEAEDVVIARTHRPALEREGIRFAPAEVASRFAYERTLPTGREFGFHGALNLMRLLSSNERVSLVRELDGRMLAPNERRELLQFAIARGQVRLAAAILAKFVLG